MEPGRVVYADYAHNEGAEAQKMLFGLWDGEKIRVRIADLFSESLETIFGVKIT